LKNATTKKNATPAEMPLLVGSASRSGDRPGHPAFELEVRVTLTPTQARLLRRLPIVGSCVRQWSMPIPAGDWRPHPTVPGVEIQFGAA
jgi:hypothetical protein